MGSHTSSCLTIQPETYDRKQSLLSHKMPTKETMNESPLNPVILNSNNINNSKILNEAALISSVDTSNEQTATKIVLVSTEITSKRDNDSKYMTKLIITGFLRRYSDDMIPMDIKTVILLFVKDMIISFRTIHWNFNDIHCMNKLLKLQNKQKLFGPECKININGFICFIQCKLKKYGDDKIDLYFKINNDFIPDDKINKLKQITLYLEISCIEINLSFKCCSSIHQNGYWSWNCLEIKQNKLKQLKSLSFCFYIQLLSIQCHKTLDIFHENIYLNPIQSYRWYIDYKILKELNGNIYSNNFDNLYRNWCLKCISSNDGASKSYAIWLGLVKIPQNIYSVEVDCKLYGNHQLLTLYKGNNRKRRGDRCLFDRDYSWIGWNVNHLFINFKKKKVEFYVTIKILRVNGVDIKSCDYSKYNIIS